MSTSTGSAPYLTADALLDALVAARDRGDVDAGLECYEPDALVVLEPGRTATGTDAVRAMLETFISWRPTFDVRARTILQTDEAALHLSAWTLRGTDPTGAPLDLAGRSSDVARRRPDGSWRLVVDDPWGTDLLATEPS
jgi:ketosteroid isomerase-like protein